MDDKSATSPHEPSGRPQQVLDYLMLHLQGVFDFFFVNKANFPEERELLRARLILFFVFIYLFAWTAHIPMYLALGNAMAASLVAVLGLSSALLGAWLLRRRKVHAAALSANVGGLTVLIAITVATGGVHSPIPAWFFFGIMTSFLMLGVRGGWLITGYVMLAFTAIAITHWRTDAAMNWFPFTLASQQYDYFILFVYLVSISSLAMVTSIYDYLQRKGYTELSLVHRDITELNSALVVMLDNVRQGILTVLPDGTVHHQYSSFLSSILFTKDIGGKHIQGVLLKWMQVDDEKRHRCAAALTDSFHRHIDHFYTCSADLISECALRFDNNEEKIVDIEWVPIVNNSRIVHKILVTLRDVTMERHLQRDTRDHEQKRIVQSKMAALGEMAAGISHEINNPLAIINGGAEVITIALQKENFSHEMVMKRATKIMEQSKRISAILDGLAKFAGDDKEVPMKAYNIRKIVDSAMALMSGIFAKNEIAVNVIAPSDEDLMVVIDESRLMQVLIDLLQNAVHAVHDNRDRPKQIDIIWQATGKFITLLVHDNGSGIPPHIAEKVFNPFFTTKPVGQGTGLGLSMSKGIIEKMGGRISFNSLVGNTTFQIELVASTASKAAA